MRIGVDLGGTKIETVVLTENGRELYRERISAPKNDYNETILAVRDLVNVAADEAGCLPETPVGIGIPGAVSPRTGLVKNANSTWLIGHPMDKDLEAALKRPVRVANDANCFAVSEAVDGAGAGFSMVFGIILGTGVGGGIAIEGRTHAGLNSIAGEWGHNPLPWPQNVGGLIEHPGPKCYCGESGCIETYLSGPALAKDHEAANGEILSTRDLAAAAEAGVPAAVETIRRYVFRLSRALAGVINILDPDVIVFGGGLSNLDILYDNVPRYLNGLVFSDSCHTPCLKNKHGDSSGVRGAAWLWPPGEAHTA